jgi:hypothetical protein
MPTSRTRIAMTQFYERALWILANLCPQVSELSPQADRYVFSPLVASTSTSYFSIA